MNSAETFEVELKFSIPDADDMTLQLLARGARRGGIVEQSDLYFQHPSRDFRQTHEALRLRKTRDGVRITYKGPIIDTRTKTRREIELPVGRGTEDSLTAAHAAHGAWLRSRSAGSTAFAPSMELMWEGRELELAVDSVEGLGTFLKSSR